MEDYALSVVGLLAVCLLSLGLAMYSGVPKGRAGLLAGPVADARDDNILYRIGRVHMNSVEAFGPFAVAGIMAILVQVGPSLLATLVWVHVAIRLVHTVVYLRGGGAAKGGKLRTILYVASALVTLALILATAWHAVT